MVAVIGTAIEVVLQRYPVIAAISLDDKVIAFTCKGCFLCLRTLKAQRVRLFVVVTVVFDGIFAMTGTELVGIAFNSTTFQMVITSATIKRVMSGSAVEVVIAFVAVQNVIAALSIQRVIAATAVQLVITFPASKIIVTLVAKEFVITDIANNVVIAAQSVNGIARDPSSNAVILVTAGEFKFFFGNIGRIQLLVIKLEGIMPVMFRIKIVANPDLVIIAAISTNEQINPFPVKVGIS